MSWRSPSTTDGPGKRGAQTVEVATIQALRSVIPGRIARLSLALGLGFVALLFVPSLLADRPSTPRAAQPVALPTPTTEHPAPALPLDDRAVYWLGAHEIDGVTPDLAPGTPVEIWVTWEPPLVDQASVEKLITDAYIKAVLPSTMIEGSFDVGIALKDRDIRLMTYGERFGSLNLIVLP